MTGTVTDAERAVSAHADYDVAVVGASLAGCATAIFLARSGARVALIEKSPNPQAFKHMCSHYIQASALGTLERLNLLDPIIEAGGVRARTRLWTRWGGWIEPLEHAAIVPAGINLRRQLLDPLVRDAAGDTPGVELMLGLDVRELTHDGRRVSGLRAYRRNGSVLSIGARLVVGADGRGSRMAKLAKVHKRTVGLKRFTYGGYFEGPTPKGAPNNSSWFLNPDYAGMFPTDDGLFFYAATPNKPSLPLFRENPAEALIGHVAKVPVDPPPIRESRLIEPVRGKIDLTNVAHTPTTSGLALVGDAALAIDPLWGVGCGWAFQSAEWLADSVAPALGGSEPLSTGLRRYRLRHARHLLGHKLFMYNQSAARKANPMERTMFRAAASDERLAARFEEFGSRSVGLSRMISSTAPLVWLVTARRMLGLDSASGS